MHDDEQTLVANSCTQPEPLRRMTKHDKCCTNLHMVACVHNREHGAATYKSQEMYFLLWFVVIRLKFVLWR